jgi:hypothetical protein
MDPQGSTVYDRQIVTCLVRVEPRPQALIGPQWSEFSCGHKARSTLAIRRRRLGARVRSNLRYSTAQCGTVPPYAAKRALYQKIRLLQDLKNLLMTGPKETSLGISRPKISRARRTWQPCKPCGTSTCTSGTELAPHRQRMRPVKAAVSCSIASRDST